MQIQIGNLILILPALVMIGAAILVLLLGVIAAKRPHKGLDYFFPAQYGAPVFTAIATGIAGWLVWVEIAAIKSGNYSVNAVGLFTVAGNSQLTVDPFAAILSFVALAGTLVVMFLSQDHFGEDMAHKAEYYSLLMFAAAAASLAAAAADLIAIYLSIEFLSLISYVLAAYSKSDRRSAEAGLKYFLYGAACSAVMLYGMSILFGITGGNTSLSAIAMGFTGPILFSPAGWVAVTFILVGLGFKLALVPFHFWAPDTYEGAPTPVTAFLSVVSKAAGLAVIVRFLTVLGSHNSLSSVLWYWMLIVLTAITMFYGNMVAIWQRNIKRMLAYSSIAQVGYLMIGVLTGMHAFWGPDARWTALTSAVQAKVMSTSAPWDIPGVLVYVFTYLLMNLGAFAIVVVIGKRLKSDSIDSYAGMIRRAPFLAGSLTVFLLSLAGIPPTAGFLGKLLIFGEAVKTGMNGNSELVVLAVLGVVNSVISAYYYMNIVRLMFFAPSEAKADIRAPFSMNAVIGVLLLLTLATLVFAMPVIDTATRAIYTIIGTM